MLVSASILVIMVAVAIVVGIRSVPAESTSALVIDRNGMSKTFDGIGGISGGGGTSRLLIDYKEPQRSQILDYLFKPSFGASLQILKVEIGGDSQSTDGSESSHMHTAKEVNYHSGYEWWLMLEAKKRNPDIKLHALAWTFPNWVGNGSGSPCTNPSLTASYIVKWLQGARDVHKLTIDYVGTWNERYCPDDSIVAMRNMLDATGFQKTGIVARDLHDTAWICRKMQKSEALRSAVSAMGIHYPRDTEDYSGCHSMNKPVWASEESSSYDDANGAACWARVINSHWVRSQMTSSLMWNLVGSYYHGTNWYASSMLTAVQPWSGHYWVAPVVWATAHVTQFTKIGWKYLKNGAGSGELAQGGYYVTWVDPDGTDFTIVVVKISRKHASCTRPPLSDFNTAAEELTINLDSSLGNVEVLNVWYSNFEDGPPYTTFEKSDPIHPVKNSFTLTVPVGGYFTLTTLTDGEKGSAGDIPESSPQFPLPYSDTFDAVIESQEARYFADQIGTFEVHPAAVNAAEHKGVMTQMVPAPTITVGWMEDFRGPMTVLGMREWQDVQAEVDFLIPLDAPAVAAACVATRADQMWRVGLVLCVNGAGHYALSLEGPHLVGLVGGKAKAVPALVSGTVPDFDNRVWHHLNLITVGDRAIGILDGKVLFRNSKIRNSDTGFVALGTNGWFPVQFDNFKVDRAGNCWSSQLEPTKSCSKVQAGDALTVRDCTTNGLASTDQMFELLPSYEIRHVPSGLCATAHSGTFGYSIALQKCERRPNQIFTYDYTVIRHAEQPLKQGKLVLAVSEWTRVASLHHSGKLGFWQQWTYFPNTQQLRNQYVTVAGRGYPQCLSTCPAKWPEIFYPRSGVSLTAVVFCVAIAVCIMYKCVASDRIRNMVSRVRLRMVAWNWKKAMSSQFRYAKLGR